MMMMPHTLSLPLVFAGIRRICDAEIVELHLASLRAARAACDMLDEAEKQLVLCTRRVANANSDERPKPEPESWDCLIRELTACGQKQAMGIQSGLEKHLSAEMQRLMPLAVTVDRLVEHLKLISQESITGRLSDSTSAVPAKEETLAGRLGRFRANLSLPERAAGPLAALVPLSAYGAGIAAVSSGVFSACHSLLTDLEGEQGRHAGDASLPAVSDRIKLALEGSRAERRKSLEGYVRCVFSDLKHEVYSALTDARKALDAAG